MTIVSQNRKSIFNYENVFGVAVIGEYVHVFYNKNESCAIGKYATEQRACEILDEFVSRLEDPKFMWLYKMPKE